MCLLHGRCVTDDLEKNTSKNSARGYCQLLSITNYRFSHTRRHLISVVISAICEITTFYIPMTFDGRTGMSLTWNDLGLVKKVSLNDTVLVNYSYLADGTKVSALDGDGDGLLYLGFFDIQKDWKPLGSGYKPQG